MIDDRYVEDPTDIIISMTEMCRESYQKAGHNQLSGWGIPPIWDNAISFMQMGIRSLMDDEQQMEWYRVEKQLLHQLRLVYSDMDEDEIIDRWAHPDSPDRG